MSRYADVSRCPDCGSPLTADATACPSCALPLRGPKAHELYVTLSHADELLAALRAVAQAPVALPADHPADHPAVLSRRAATRSGSRGLSGASVPKLLLSVGALCLLVAALVFLAVTWSVLGVGGRTATLVGFTVVAAAVTAVVARRGLRGATEALGLVSLGLLALDVAGADHAGWFGDLAASSFLVLLGGVLVTAATGACLAVRATPARTCTAGELVVALGWCLVVAGIDLAGSAPTTATGALAATLLTGAGTSAAHRLHLAVAARADATVTGLAWLLLVLTGLDGLSRQLTLGHVWGDLAAWPLVAAALLLASVALLGSPVRLAREAALSGGVAILAGVLVSPALDNGPTAATVAVLAALGVALAVVGTLPGWWSAAAVLTAALGTTVAAGQTLLLVGLAGDRLGEALTSEGSLGGRLPDAFAPDGLQPWLLVPDSALTIVAALLLRRVLGSRVPVRAGVIVAAVAVATATAVLHPVPVWTVVAALLLAGLVLLVADDLVPAALVLAAATVIATYSDGLTAIALGTVLVSATVVHLRDRRELAAAAAGLVTATTLAASFWVWGDLLERPEQWTAALGIIVVAASGLAWHRPGTDVGAAVGVVGLGLAGLGRAPAEQAATWVAVYLTLAGAATCLEALLRRDRRPLGWVGGVLLAAASWVRLADVGVSQPEPYTLPAALVLLVVGVGQLRRQAEEDTLRSLGAGLGLALVPSLLWVLDDPTTVRSLLLGLACLALVVAGLRLRWTAPLLFGCVVGAAIVLRSAAPYVGDAVPRWASIGTAGMLLVALGITWEARVREARMLLGYVRQLR